MIVEVDKWHNAKNTFALVRKPIELSPQAIIRMCDSELGLSTDGVVILSPATEDFDVQMRYFNRDASKSAICGNATLCVAMQRYEELEGIKKEIRVMTDAGLKVAQISEDGWVIADMGYPIFDPEKIPVLSRRKDAMDIIFPLKTYGFIPMSVLSLGNPHAVINAKDLPINHIDEIDMTKLGSEIEHHPWFPEGTNFEAFQVMEDGTMEMRVWERGDGITKACGTGAEAAVIAAKIRRLIVTDWVNVHVLGGWLKVGWAGSKIDLKQPVSLGGKPENLSTGTRINLPV